MMRTFDLVAAFEALAHETCVVGPRCAGHQIFYAARYGRLTALLRLLVEDRCAKAPSGCLPGRPDTRLERDRR